MFNVDALLDSLPIMGLGMLGIFIVIGIIMGIIWILSKVFPVKQNETKESK
jgi:Na+-transporting methylmalonyl-CoA/oxaloacetate decarboxylase gamma subunit